MLNLSLEPAFTVNLVSYSVKYVKKKYLDNNRSDVYCPGGADQFSALLDQ